MVLGLGDRMNTLCTIHTMCCQPMSWSIRVEMEMGEQ